MPRLTTFSESNSSNVLRIKLLQRSQNQTPPTFSESNSSNVLRIKLLQRSQNQTPPTFSESNSSNVLRIKLLQRPQNQTPPTFSESNSSNVLRIKLLQRSRIKLFIGATPDTCFSLHITPFIRHKIFGIAIRIYHLSFSELFKVSTCS